MLSAVISLFPLPGLPVLALVLGLGYLRRWRPMRIITVIDGDTVMAVDRRGRKRKLRIEGIDAPELGQRKSLESKGFIERAATKQWVRVQLRGRDRYRRHLARIEVQGRDLASELVRTGLAYPTSRRFAGLGLIARLARRGIHSGFGQRKPWQSASRSSFLGRVLNRRRYRHRRK